MVTSTLKMLLAGLVNVVSRSAHANCNDPHLQLRSATLRSAAGHLTQTWFGVWSVLAIPSHYRSAVLGRPWSRTKFPGGECWLLRATEQNSAPAWRSLGTLYAMKHPELKHRRHEAQDCWNRASELDFECAHPYSQIGPD